MVNGLRQPSGPSLFSPDFSHRFNLRFPAEDSWRAIHPRGWRPLFQRLMRYRSDLFPLLMAADVEQDFALDREKCASAGRQVKTIISSDFSVKCGAWITAENAKSGFNRPTTVTMGDGSAFNELGPSLARASSRGGGLGDLDGCVGRLGRSGSTRCPPAASPARRSWSQLSAALCGNRGGRQFR